jgi:hypothetical protein
MKELLRTQDVGHAHLLCAALEAEGIDAFVQGDHAGAVFDGGVSLYIRNNADFPRALAVVSEVEGDNTP